MMQQVSSRGYRHHNLHPTLRSFDRQYRSAQQNTVAYSTYHLVACLGGQVA